MSLGDDATTARSLPPGCGGIAREELEVAAATRADGVPIEDAVEAHLFACAECRRDFDRMVARASADQGLLAEAARAAPRPARIAPDEDPDAPIAGYRLGEELHRGGQGSVFAAEQLATRRRCAVKTLLGGRFATDRERARFEREVEVVARLRHPSVVTLYESGIMRDGTPWFAMELVEGERIDAHVATGGLAPRAIARLFRDVAAAVAYAHRRGVIHRDLKPGNILVDREGTPRILDFGLARADEGDLEAAGAAATRAGEFLGTFAYAAPEQLAGDPAAVDSRCDLYALGVALFECLTGRRPYEGARTVVELAQQKQGPPQRKPRELRAGIDRDLEVIALHLLAPEPARRYDTADALVDDLERYLDGRPILAREDSLAYVVGKTLRRHWIASGAAGIFLLTIVGAAVALSVAYANAERERIRSERTLRSFQDAVASVNPEAGRGSADLTVEEFLSLIEQNAAQELASEPRVLAGVLETIGLVHIGFEDAPAAERALTRALEERMQLQVLGEASELEVAESRHNMGRLRILQGRVDEAIENYEAALDARTAALGPSDRLTLLTARHLASSLRRVKRLDEAARLYDDILARAKEAGLDLGEVAAIRNGRAFVFRERGELALALAEFEEALAAIRPMASADDWRVGRGLFNCASVEVELGRLDDALAHAVEARDILRRRKGGDATTVREAERLVERVEAARAARP